APAVSRGRAFARDDRGVTAIEFGILALPFFTIIFAILETTMVFFAAQVLDSAVEDASRMIKTGQAQAAGYGMGDFRTLLCDSTFDLFGTDCAQVQIRVAKISDFSSTTTSSTVQSCDYTGTKTCTWTLAQDFDAGIGREVIQVFAYYRWPLLISLPYFNLRNQPDNYRLIGGTRVFRNEPFTAAATP
ncbi:MAG: TadE/TadG family type IV pilus assembly protein, partial [Devosia sp.]